MRMSKATGEAAEIKKTKDAGIGVAEEDKGKLIGDEYFDVRQSQKQAITLLFTKNDARCVIDKFPIHTQTLPSSYVSRYEERPGGIFSSKYILYNIMTIRGVNWEVQRRYSDFLWLRQTLVKLYPHLIIPPIPKKEGWHYDAPFLNKRMDYFEVGTILRLGGFSDHSSFIAVLEFLVEEGRNPMQQDPDNVP